MDTTPRIVIVRDILDIVWYICWCNYMTRVADAFQIPLEGENVFMEPKKAAKTKAK